VNALKGRPNERRPPGAIVLLSDGKATSGRDPLRVAQEARELKIPIYTVALGTPDGTIQVKKSDGTTETQQVPPDTETMRRVAELSGVRSYAIDDASELERVYKQLGSQVALKDEKREITAWLAGAALALLVAASIPQLKWFARPV